MLKAEEEIAGYLNDAYNDDDPATFVITLGDVAKMRGIEYVAEQVVFEKFEEYIENKCV